jgi:hypothetical protein
MRIHDDDDDDDDILRMKQHENTESTEQNRDHIH